MFALPLDEVVRIHSLVAAPPASRSWSATPAATSTRGPSCTARVAAAAGVHRGDLVQMAFLYGMFTGGWGMHYGIERIGATIIPAGAGQTERHLMMMQDFGTTVLVSTPVATRSTSPSRARRWASTSRRSRCAWGCSAASRAPTG